MNGAPSLWWFLGFTAFIIAALCLMWWLGMHYERRSWTAEDGSLVIDGDPQVNVAMWQDGYDAACRDLDRETQILDEADQYIGQLHADDFTTGTVFGPGELDITSRDPNDSLAERLTSTGELAMLSGHLQAATFLDMLEGWPDRVLAEIWGPDTALATIPNGAHHE